VVGPTTVAPNDNDPYDVLYANAGVLAKAGVLVAFQTSSARSPPGPKPTSMEIAPIVNR